jgi:erythromycin esterase
VGPACAPSHGWRTARLQILVREPFDRRTPDASSLRDIGISNDRGDIAPTPADGGSHEERASFLEWARKALTPLSAVAPPLAELAPFGEIVGDATVVALGEGDHMVAEPLEFRNRALQYLVEEKGFTAVALESGIVESRVLHDYVRGCPGNLLDVVHRGLTWAFDELPQNQALVRWLREYNSDPRRPRTVNFYGFDLPGSPSNANARCGIQTALIEALAYLARVDPPVAADLDARLKGILSHLRFDLLNVSEKDSYHTLNRHQRDTLTATIVDLIAQLECHESRYTEASSPNDYDWAHRAAIGARQVDGWLRHIPMDWRAEREQLRFMDLAAEHRERAQADNLDWIVRREGSSGKVLMFAHNAHLSAAPSKWRYWPLNDSGEIQFNGGGISYHAPAGTYLRRKMGERLVIVANLVGNFNAEQHARTSESAASESLDEIAQEVGVPLYLLDLRAAPPKASEWLAKERQVGPGFEWPRKYKHTIELAGGRAFDAIFYNDTSTPAHAEN